ncbi:MAG TPA: type II toxin-antitoxin system RelE/ParE family toxin [Rhizomicrobium sp.]|nr:type II toxin-antitoxin system RelE/ParE family toxin [Rhizomicrobium sp.]
MSARWARGDRRFLARHPDAGDLIKGSGGCRKVRIAGRGKGKSGGYRLISFYSGVNIPVFLLTIYSKDAMGNLSNAQVNTLKLLTKELIDTYDT